MNLISTFMQHTGKVSVRMVRNVSNVIAMGYVTEAEEHTFMYVANAAKATVEIDTTTTSHLNDTQVHLHLTDIHGKQNEQLRSRSSSFHRRLL